MYVVENENILFHGPYGVSFKFKSWGVWDIDSNGIGDNMTRGGWRF